MYSKLIIAGVSFLLILLSGFWLSGTGRPLNSILLTVHKLISVAAVVYLIVNVIKVHRTTPLSPFEIGLSLASLLFFLVMVATGGLLSTAKTMPVFVHKIHQIMPYVVILTTSITLYQLLIRKILT
jgi:heme A synthase